MTNLKTMTAADLIARLVRLETISRHARDAEQLAAEWRAVAAELNSRPTDEVMAA